MKLFLTIFITICLNAIVNCQSYGSVIKCCQVTIQVKDSLTGDTIPNAEVKYLTGNNENDITQNVVKGEAVFWYMKPQKTTFTITADGYQSSDIIFNIQNNNENDSTFYLRRNPNIIRLHGKVTMFKKKKAKGLKVTLNVGNFSVDTITSKGGEYSFAFDLSKFTMQSIEGGIVASRKKCKTEKNIQFDSKQNDVTRNIALNCKPKYFTFRYLKAPIIGTAVAAGVYGYKARNLKKNWNEDLENNNYFDIHREYPSKNKEYKCYQKKIWGSSIISTCISVVWYCFDIKNYKNRKIELTNSSNTIGLSLKF